jgi:hypothetical protein
MCRNARNLETSMRWGSHNAVNICMSGSTSWGPEDDSKWVETCSPYCYNILWEYYKNNFVFHCYDSFPLILKLSLFEEGCVDVRWQKTTTDRNQWCIMMLEAINLWLILTDSLSISQSTFLLHTEEATYDQIARFVVYPVLFPFCSTYFYSLRVDILITHA